MDCAVRSVTRVILHDVSSNRRQSEGALSVMSCPERALALAATDEDISCGPSASPSFLHILSDPRFLFVAFILLKNWHDFCGKWLLEVTSCHALDDCARLRVCLSSFYCSSFIVFISWIFLLLLIYCFYFLDLFIAHHLFVYLYLYLVSSFGLRSSCSPPVSFCRRARLLIRLGILPCCCTLPQPCSARSGHISLALVEF